MTRDKAKEIISYHKILVKMDKSGLLDKELEYQAIDMAIEALEQPRWIPMVEREPTDKEKAEYLAQHGEELCYMLENEMPLNGQEVLVSTKSGIYMDIFSGEFYNFENIDIRDVTAWMPLPTSYKAESEDKKE